MQKVIQKKNTSWWAYVDTQEWINKKLQRFAKNTMFLAVTWQLYRWRCQSDEDKQKNNDKYKYNDNDNDNDNDI